jgi:hypothetical protein
MTYALAPDSGDYADSGDVGAVERLRELSAKLHTAAMSTLAWDDLRYFLAFARAGSMQTAAKVTTW